MEVKCDYCDEYFPSMEKKIEHLVSEHDMYKDSDTNIVEDTINRMRTTMARVKYLHERFPSCRGDDRILELMYLRLFDKSFVYNANTKTIQLRNQNGLTYEEWRMQTTPASIDRAGRKIREQFPDLQPTPKTVMKRKVKEMAMRQNMPKITFSKKEYDDLNENLK